MDGRPLKRNKKKIKIYTSKRNCLFFYSRGRDNKFAGFDTWPVKKKANKYVNLCSKATVTNPF